MPPWTPIEHELLQEFAPFVRKENWLWREVVVEMNKAAEERGLACREFHEGSIRARFGYQVTESPRSAWTDIEDDLLIEMLLKRQVEGWSLEKVAEEMNTAAKQRGIICRVFYTPSIGYRSRKLREIGRISRQTLDGGSGSSQNDAVQNNYAQASTSESANPQNYSVQNPPAVRDATGGPTREARNPMTSENVQFSSSSWPPTMEPAVNLGPGRFPDYLERNKKT